MGLSIQELLTYTIGLFVIVDPFGAIAGFLTLTRGATAKASLMTALKASIAGSALLILFALTGEFIFRALGLQLSALKTGGGFLLLVTALEMLRAKKSNCKCSPTEMKAQEEREDVSIVPLAIPMLAGPGAITSVVVFTSSSSGLSVQTSLIAILGILMTFLLSFIVLALSLPIKKALGESGLSVLHRVMGILLVALAIQFIAEGSISLYRDSQRDQTVQQTAEGRSPSLQTKGVRHGL